MSALDFLGDNRQRLGVPSKLELAVLERLFMRMGIKFSQAGRWSDEHRKALALLQRKLDVQPTGLLDDKTRENLGVMYSYLGGTKNGPTLDELGWQKRGNIFDQAVQGARTAAGMVGGLTRSYSESYASAGGGFTLGGGGGGVGGDYDAKYGPPGSRSPEAIRRFIQDKYPGWAPFLNHPEIGRILLEAGQWDHDELWVEGQLMGTNWWKSQSEAQREWEKLTMLDPAEAARQQEGRFTDLYDWNRQWGLGLSADSVKKIATDSLRLGWSEGQIKEHLANFVGMDDTKRTGLVSDVFDEAHNLGGEYFVGIDDETALDFARRVISGELNAESLQGYFRDQAKKQYAHLANQLDQGITMRQYFEPHRQTLASILEIAPESVDFLNDKTWSKVMTYTDEDGKTRSMNITEVAEMARKDPRWAKTRNARSTAASTIAGLGQAMGTLKL